MWQMCYLPLYIAVTCYQFEVFGRTLPQAETELHTEFTKHTLLRMLMRKRKKISYLESIEDLPAKEKKSFLKIFKLAFNITKLNEAMKTSSTSTLVQRSLGLVTVDSMTCAQGFKICYSFFHRSFQEYLAAYHVLKLAEKDQIKVIKQYRKEKHMQEMWKFFCGLVNFTNKEALFKKIVRLSDDLFAVRCSFESQQTITCSIVVKCGEKGSLSHFLSP